MRPWHVYLLQCSDGKYYCGITTNLEKRLKQHNGALEGGAAFTRSRRPVTLICSCLSPDKSSALKLEAKIKKLPRRQKIHFLTNHASV